MDFFELAWIALIVFYFLARSLGGNKRKTKTTGSAQRTQRPQHGTQRKPDDELSVALDEIRQALGFPGGKGTSTSEEAQTGSQPSVPGEERRRTRTSGTPQRVHKATSPPSPGHPQSVDRGPSAERRRDVQPMHDRPKPSPLPTGIPTPSDTRPSDSDVIVPDLPPLKSSFREEETFEKTGRHPHQRTRHDLRVINPYDAPKKKQLPSVLRTLEKRSSLRDAILLKEILDRPISLRRR